MGKLVNRKTDGSGKRLTKTRAPRSKKMSPAGAKVVAAFQEAINVMRSGESLPGRLTVRSFHAEFVRPSYGPEDVRRVRRPLEDEPGFVCAVPWGRPEHSPLVGAGYAPSQFDRATIHGGDRRESNILAPADF